MPKSDFLTVAKLGDIPDGEGRAFEYNDQMVAVFNDGGQFRAIDDMCPHMGASLAAGHLDDGVVTCPWHSWSFDTRDGAWCENRRISVDTFEVRIVGNEIQIAARPKQSEKEAGSSATSKLTNQCSGDDSGPIDSPSPESGRESSAEKTNE